MARQRIAHLDEEKREWLNITNFNVWRVLKLVNGGGRHIRAIMSLFKGSTFTLGTTVNSLVRWGLLSEDKEETWPFKRTLALTEDGVKMLGLLDEIGEMVKGIRSRIEVKERLRRG
ncbi:hypothetical protein ES706_02393 [subsurface metagenome]